MSNTLLSVLLSKRWLVFIFGGFCYGALEILWRGYTHPSMILLGGICLYTIYCLEKKIIGKISVFYRAIIYAVIITLLEFISGIILNLKMGLDVWDYSMLPVNLNGQICLLFSLLWFGLSLFGCFVCKLLRIVLSE